jgi:hypothetical protein
LAVIGNRKRHIFIKPAAQSLEPLSTDPQRARSSLEKKIKTAVPRRKTRARLFVNAAQWLRGGNITYYILCARDKKNKTLLHSRAHLSDQKYSFWQRRHTEKGDARVLEAGEGSPRKGKSQLEWSSTNVGRETQHPKLWHYLSPGTDWPLFPFDSASVWEVYTRRPPATPRGSTLEMEIAMVACFFGREILFQGFLYTCAFFCDKKMPKTIANTML